MALEGVSSFLQTLQDCISFKQEPQQPARPCVLSPCSLSCSPPPPATLDSRLPLGPASTPLHQGLCTCYALCLQVFSHRAQGSCLTSFQSLPKCQAIPDTLNKIVPTSLISSQICPVLYYFSLKHLLWCCIFSLHICYIHSITLCCILLYIVHPFTVCPH